MMGMDPRNFSLTGALCANILETVNQLYQPAESVLVILTGDSDGQIADAFEYFMRVCCQWSSSHSFLPEETHDL